MIRDCFALAKKKIEENHSNGSIIFIDEVRPFFGILIIGGCYWFETKW